MSILGFNWRPSIRVRLTLLYAGTVFLAGLVLITLIYLQLGGVLTRQLFVWRSGMDQTAWTRQAAPDGVMLDGATPDGATSDDYILLTDQNAPSPIPPGAIVRQFELRRDPSVPVQPGVAPVPDEVAANFRLAMETGLQRARTGTLQRMLITSIVLLGFLGAVSGALGWLLAGQALAPLRQITATARRVADRNLHERIALEGPQDEIKDLADTLDSMLARLDQAFDSQQRFIANASHELRTPLAINRTLIEVALMEDTQPSERFRQFGSTLLAVNQRHERLIDGLLTLASSEQRIVDPAPVDLAEIAGQVVGEAEKRARDAKLDIRLELKPAPAMGEPILLERLVENLIENAVRYNFADGGWIRIATRVVDDRAELFVENPGPVIPHYDAPRLFQPFQRLSRTERRADPTGASTTRGAGLGLSIVRAVARAHGGDATAEPRDEGGLVVRVRLPAVRLSDDEPSPAGASANAGQTPA